MEHHTMTFNTLPVGACAVVTEITGDRKMRDRLAQLGLLPGASVRCVMRGTGGSPTALEVQGAVIALREDTCKQIKVLPEAETAQGPVVCLLAGNPNVGKSTVFNVLTGMKQHTGNWCGKTVAAAEGFFSYHGEQIRLLDLPGTCSLFSETAEEAAACDLIAAMPHHCIICVADATCLERGISLVLQMLHLHRHIVLCVNLMDEAARKHIRIDLEQLSAVLRIPVVGISAHKKKTVSALPAAAVQIHSEKPLHPILPAQEQRAEITAEAVREAVEICRKTVTVSGDPRKTEMRLDRLLTGKMFRIPLMCALLLLTFWITLIGANYPSAMLAAFSNLLCTGCHGLASRLSCPAWLSGALIDGMLRGVGWVVSVMLPPMLIFFPLFTLLEDIGILPRIAFNMDRCFAGCGACGKQCLTMTMGFGCNAVGVTECRIIQSKRERLIAVLTNAFVPCNGRFPALIAVITVFFAGNDACASLRSAATLSLLILLSIGMTLAASALLGKTVLRGQSSMLVLELPPYRRPQIGQILVRSFIDRTLRVLGRAVLTAAPVSLLIWCCANAEISGVSLLSILADMLCPAGKILGLDGIILLGFLLGLPANEMILPVTVTAYLGTKTLTDYGTLSALQTTLTANGWTAVTAVCFLLLMLFHAPCATTILTVYRETGSRKWTAAAIFLPLAAGLILCAAVNSFCELFF